MLPSELEIETVRACRAALRSRIIQTPVAEWRGPKLRERLGGDGEVMIKLELLQHTGSFKARGALNVVRSLTAEQRARGLTAVSAGNHAIAAAFAGHELGASAKVVMTRTASPVRVARARAYGAEVVLADDVAQAFELVDRIAADEGRIFVHPFEGPLTAQGTATLGLEYVEQAGPFDAVIIPIGGGGLCAGMASAIKQLLPNCEVFGVEPEGAQSMRLSFDRGEPVHIGAVNTIADSLGAPMALPFSYGVCRDNVDDIVLVSDDQLRDAMRLIFDELKLAVEPAGAASTAALLGPLKDRLEGRRVGLIACGANIDLESFHTHVAAGRPTD